MKRHILALVVFLRFSRALVSANDINDNGFAVCQAFNYPPRQPQLLC